MKKFIAAALALCLCATTIQAQDYLKNYSAKAPLDLAGANIDGLIEGKTLLKSGRELKWALMYDKKQNKPMIMTFTCPDDVNKEIFDADIQAMTVGQFWTGISNCLILPSNNDSVECIIQLQRTALTDCTRTLSSSDCWMINR